MLQGAEGSMKWKYLVILAVSLGVYLVCGAFTFRATESGFEKESRKKLQKAYNDFLSEHPETNTSRLYAFTAEIIQLESSLGRLSITQLNTSGYDPIWNFHGALMFTLTVVTTIGYGHVYPSTTAGRAICIAYALLGIPLTLIFLGAVGDKMVSIAMRMGQVRWSRKHPGFNKALNTWCVLLAGMIIMFLLPAIIFHVIEGWSFGGACYYCFITLSTIGFGDSVAGLHNEKLDNSPWFHVYRVFVYLWILMGLSYLSVVIKYIMRMYLKRADKQRSGKHRPKKPYPSEEILQDALCTKCFVKLQNMVERGYDIQKIVPSRSNSLYKLPLSGIYANKKVKVKLRRTLIDAEFSSDILNEINESPLQGRSSLPNIRSTLSPSGIRRTTSAQLNNGALPSDEEYPAAMLRVRSLNPSEIHSLAGTIVEEEVDESGGHSNEGFIENDEEQLPLSPDHVIVSTSTTKAREEIILRADCLETVDEANEHGDKTPPRTSDYMANSDIDSGIVCENGDAGSRRNSAVPRQRQSLKGGEVDVRLETCGENSSPESPESERTSSVDEQEESIRKGEG